MLSGTVIPKLRQGPATMTLLLLLTVIAQIMTDRATIGLLFLIPDELITVAEPYAVGALLRFRKRIALHWSEQFDASFLAILKVKNRAVGCVGHHALKPAANNLLDSIDHGCQRSGIANRRFTLVAENEVTRRFNDSRRCLVVEARLNYLQ